MKIRMCFFLLLNAFFLLNCNVPIPVTEPLPIATIQSGGLIGSVLGVQNFDLPIVSGSQQLPPGAQSITLKTLAIRSVLNSASDQSTSALENDSLVDQCPTGRASLGFIQSVTISIKHQSEDDSQAVTLATYTNTDGSDPCGFHMQTTGVDIKSYISDYALVTQVSGSSPEQDVQISGYLELVDDEGT